MATLGSITASSQSLPLGVPQNSGTVVLSLSGTFGGHNVAFEGTVDGTNWFGVQAVRTNANVIEASSGALSAAPAYGWRINSNGLTGLRVRSTAHSSGTAVWAWSHSAEGSEPNPVVSQLEPTVSTLNSAATTNATSVKTSGGIVYGVVASNINAAIRYLKIYNKASAPTVGTDVPVLTLAIPLTGVLSLNLGPLGLKLGTGIAFALTTGAADSDTAAVAANEIKVALSYV